MMENSRSIIITNYGNIIITKEEDDEYTIDVSGELMWLNHKQLTELITKLSEIRDGIPG